jgi:hypothetical protein
VGALINLRDLAEQKLAIRNMADMLKTGGRLILVEGYRDGFDQINALRAQMGISLAKPAAINFYSALSELMPTILDLFSLEANFNTGVFDFLTRVVHPSLVGPEEASGPSDFHVKIEPIIKSMEGSELSRFARLHGFSLARK